MALKPGTRLGAYEVTAQIGVGGMGEVYRARDSKLKRDVAIWAPSGIIYFVPAGGAGVWAVPSSGGAPREITRLDPANGEVSHRWPQWLPGGKELLFTIWTGLG